jgi:16S rRNA U516 pseudouridylate synthase RsuA-like enzyme
MIKRAVIRAPARGYVDGRFIGEEKEPADALNEGHGKGRGKGGAGRRGKANADSVLSGDNIGNTTAKRRTRSGAGAGAGTGRGRAAGGAGVSSRTRGVNGATAGQGARTDGATGGRRRPPGQGDRGGDKRQAASAQGQGVSQGRRQAQPRTGGQGRSPRQVPGQGSGQASGQGQSRDPGRTKGRTQSQGQRGPRAGGLGLDGQGTSPFISDLGQDSALRGAARTKQRRGSTGKKSPFRTGSALTHEISPTQGSDLRRLGDEAKSGQFAEALAASATVKRERLHKVLAQSGHGSRRDMEIMISSGRVMVNGIVATTGTQVAPGDNVLVDQRHVKLKFTEDTPRVLLYHKPEGEIVTTNDPGNRITVFDNLPRVETGKWVAVGRLDINTSGLLIFTTSGELANRFMHPRYEVEREYAVRILGELTEDQTKLLLAGVKIDENTPKAARDEDDDRFNRIDAGDDSEDEFEDEIYDVEPDDDLVPPAMPDDDEQPLAGELSGNQALAAPSVLHQSDDQPADDQPSDHQPIDARFLGAVATASTVPFPRNPLAKFDVIEKRGGEGVNQWYHVVIREGRNREVRKMFESLGLTVSRLIRTRFGKVELPPRLLRGKMVELDESQVRSVLASAGMKVEGPVAPLVSRGKNAGPRMPGESPESHHGRGSRGGDAPRGQNRTRQQNQRTGPEGGEPSGADSTGLAGPRSANSRGRGTSGRNKEPRGEGPGNRRGQEQGQGPGQGNAIATDGTTFTDSDNTGNGNIEPTRVGLDGAAIDNNANQSRAPRQPRAGSGDRNETGGRGRSSPRGGRGRRASSAPRDTGLTSGNVDSLPASNGAGNRAEGSLAEAGGDNTDGSGNGNVAPRPDNRQRGKSRRTFRGRRRTGTGSGAGAQAGGADGSSSGNAGGADHPSNSRESGGNAGGNTE